jgi:hypothetical protein
MGVDGANNPSKFDLIVRNMQISMSGKINSTHKLMKNIRFFQPNGDLVSMFLNAA